MVSDDTSSLPPAQADAGESFQATLLSWRALGVGVWASLVAVALIALAQLDGLVGQVVVERRSYSLTGLTAAGGSGGRPGTAQAWEALDARVTAVPGLGSWMSAYAAVDLVFIALYAGAGCLVLGGTVRRRGLAWPWFLVALVALLVAVAADVVESVLIAGRSGVPGPGGWADRLATASPVKWGGLAVALLAVVIAVRQGSDHPRGAEAGTPYAAAPVTGGPGALGRVLRALYTHRFSLLVVIPFAALGLASGSDILDQFPDVQRQWADDRPVLRLVLAALFNLLVAVVVWVIGRLRTHHVARRVLPFAAPYRHPSLSPWLFTALVIAVGGLVSRVVLGLDVIGTRFWIAVVVPLLIWGASLAFRRRGVDPPWSPYRRPVGRRQATTTRAVGDLLGVLVMVIPSLGLVRAFVGPVALGRGGWNLVYLVAGVLGALVCWPAVRVVGRPVAEHAPAALRTALAPGLELDPAAKWSRRTAWGLLLAGVALFVLLGFLPGWFIEALGVIEVALLAVTAVALSLGATVILLQAGGAPDVLSRSRTPVLRTAPVMTIIVLTAVAVGLTGGDTRVHGVRTLGDRALAPRPTLVDRVSAMPAEEACQAPLAGTPHRVRPVFLIAAEGGGIRAAAWTALGTDALHAAGGACARALMSSGASGGAVGLTVAAFAGSEGGAFDAVEGMAGPQALRAAVAGLLVRDPVRSVTGIAFPTGDERGWVDRAGLIEREWEDAVGGLRTPFLGGATDRVTGALVLNSTSVATRCRALLSQVALDAAPDAQSCQTATAPPDSVDLLATLRSGCSDSVPTLRASTVALLASRFPYVTPSGVVTSGCPADGTTPASQQLVDGGYADNDGIGTVVDLAGQWMPVLREHNEAVLNQAGAGAGRPLLVPVLVYLDNGAGSDIAVDAGGARNEVLVPLLTKGAATAGLSSTDSQLHRALDEFSTARVIPGCRPPSPTGTVPAPSPTPEEAQRRVLCDAVQHWRGSPVKVFYQPSRPSISAPLGWVLSSQSLQTLRCARDEQVFPALPRTSVAACAEGVVLAPEDVTAQGPARPTCSTDRAVRDRSDLDAKGYGSMLAALCLATEARDAPPPPTVTVQ